MTGARNGEGALGGWLQKGREPNVRVVKINPGDGLKLGVSQQSQEMRRSLRVIPGRGGNECDILSQQVHLVTAEIASMTPDCHGDWLVLAAVQKMDCPVAVKRHVKPATPVIQQPEHDFLQAHHVRAQAFPSSNINRPNTATCRCVFCRDKLMLHPGSPEIENVAIRQRSEEQVIENLRLVPRQQSFRGLGLHHDPGREQEVDEVVFREIPVRDLNPDFTLGSYAFLTAASCEFRLID